MLDYSNLPYLQSTLSSFNEIDFFVYELKKLLDIYDDKAIFLINHKYNDFLQLSSWYH